MATKKSAKISTLHPNQGVSRSDSTSVDGSQEADTQYWSEIIRDRQKRNSDRRNQRKQEVIARHNERMGKVNKRVQERIKKHNERVSTIRRPKLQRLVELARKKRDLQDKMNQCKADLEQPFLSTAKQFQIALEGRINELS